MPSHETTIKAKRYDAISYQMVRGEDVVGLALKLTSGRWSLVDRDDRKITKRTFATPKDAAAAAQELIP